MPNQPSYQGDLFIEHGDSRIHLSQGAREQAVALLAEWLIVMVQVLSQPTSEDTDHDQDPR